MHQQVKITQLLVRRSESGSVVFFSSLFKTSAWAYCLLFIILPTLSYGTLSHLMRLNPVNEVICSLKMEPGILVIAISNLVCNSEYAFKCSHASLAYLLALFIAYIRIEEWECGRVSEGMHTRTHTHTVKHSSRGMWLTDEMQKSEKFPL